MLSTWSDIELEYLKENYPFLGLKACVIHLNKSVSSVKYQISLLKLKKKIRHKNVNTTRTLPFLNLDTPEIIYTLGFLWADGNLYHYKKLNQFWINLCIISEDFNEIRDIFTKYYKWNISKRKRNHWKETSKISTVNTILFHFLSENDYQLKSYVSACKILSKIPENLQHYWWRGYFDGDGCIYTHKKQYIYQLSLSGSFQQNWLFVENLFIKLNIPTYNISRVNKNYSSSVIRICQKKHIYKFYDYIYKDYIENPIGLSRKYEKFKTIFN